MYLTNFYINYICCVKNKVRMQPTRASFSILPITSILQSPTHLLTCANFHVEKQPDVHAKAKGLQKRVEKPVRLGTSSLHTQKAVKLRVFFAPVRQWHRLLAPARSPKI
jgi:hypothetical protein